MESPNVRLNDGNFLPQIGLGSAFRGLDTAALVRKAVEVGYRHIDTAKAYGNDAEVGEGVRSSSVPRSEIFVTSKLFCDDHGYDATLVAFDAALERMGLDYLDLYLIHFPNPDLGLYIDTWRAMIRLRDEGRIKSIGVSNFEPEHVERLVGETGIVPVVNQVELNPRFQQRPLRRAMAELDIAVVCWSPLVHGMLLSDPVYGEIARKYGRSPAQIVLRWHLQNGLVIIPKAETPEWMRENLDIVEFELDDGDIARLDAMDLGEAGRAGPHPSHTTFKQRMEMVAAVIAKLEAQTRG